jgi:hypothetical protein
MTATPPSNRARVKRLPERGKYDKQPVYSILDEGLVCHVDIAVDGQFLIMAVSRPKSNLGKQR